MCCSQAVRQGVQRSARDPLLVLGHDSQAGPLHPAGPWEARFLEPSGLRYQEEVKLLALLAVEPPPLPQLLCKGLILHVMQHELCVGHDSMPATLQGTRPVRWLRHEVSYRLAFISWQCKPILKLLTCCAAEEA